MYAVTQRRGRLGDVCSVMANGSRVCGPTPTQPVGGQLASRVPRSYAIPARSDGARTPQPPVYAPSGSGYAGAPWGQKTPQPYGSSSPGGNLNAQSLQTSGMNLAQLQALAQTNPSALTPGQLAVLQAAGTVASTLPYSSAASLATTAPSGIDPTTGISYAQEAATAAAGTGSMDLSTAYAGIPLWGWLAGGGLAVMLIMKRK